MYPENKDAVNQCMVHATHATTELCEWVCGSRETACIAERRRRAAGVAQGVQSQIQHRDVNVDTHIHMREEEDADHRRLLVVTQEWISCGILIALSDVTYISR